MKTLKIFSFLLLLSSQLFYSQAFLQGKDLSTFKVASLSEAELVQIGKELDANQMTLEQVEPLALAKGMSKEEFIAFKARMESLPQIKSTVKQDAVEGVNASANVVDLAKKIMPFMVPNCLHLKVYPLNRIKIYQHLLITL